MKDKFLERLRHCPSEEQWDDICDEVKRYTRTLPQLERSGDYPEWWFPEVILSGLMARTAASWERA